MILLHRQEVYKRKYTADGPDEMAYFTPDDTDRQEQGFHGCGPTPTVEKRGIIPCLCAFEE